MHAWGPVPMHLTPAEQLRARRLVISAATEAEQPPPMPLGTRAPQAARSYSLRPISKDDVEFSFARSSGAGGQNVNKVSTKVDMRFDMSKANWIPEEIKEAIRTAEKNRFNKEGVLVVTSQRHRKQMQNFDDCLTKLQEIIDAGVEACTVREADAATVKKVKDSIKAGQERRLQDKKKDAMRKKERSRKDWD
eukprot:CAMPEP_0202884726 /NCGR_PEP_ID=MMETSP1391-20130828/41298_1 /ASSEMBLY_ACC=CAM_ASM_000867 /TAXON_ID=1034604 /ORGANISM="Chlamydomonas leiostraca, Strain SAG 11-49" /LENGTH=191 /DNA_ID=CAMNT_0049567953 /DNA_START=29 /DNA_END=604 /DNA_ORIENTATION=-